MYIYRILNNLSGKSYIGQTRGDVHSRFNRHCRSSSGCYAIRDSIKKYGKDNFTVEILATCKSQDELNYLEMYFINKYNTLVPNGYNLTSGGSGSSGRIVTNETRQKLKNSHSGSKGNNYGKLSKFRKPIKCSNGISYLSIWDASKKLGLHRGSIKSVLDGKMNHTKGYWFQYE